MESYTIGKDRTGDEEEQTEMVWTCGQERRDPLAPENFKFPSCWEETMWETCKTWGETITEDRRASNITHIDPSDRKAWRTAIKEMNCPTHRLGKMDFKTMMMMMG